jgi:hypothetical protein
MLSFFSVACLLQYVWERSKPLLMLLSAIFIYNGIGSKISYLYPETNLKGYDKWSMGSRLSSP